jgi:arylsulfatase A-like enzyme/Tfp pilus assembly protein PilF
MIVSRFAFLVSRWGSRFSEKRETRNEKRIFRLTAALAVTASCGCAPNARDQAAAPDASILLVTIDTLRADRIGAGITPEIDALADSGATFTNVRASAPLTLPSHVTMMTGALPPAHGVRENGTDRFDGGRPTLARLLKARGYRTSAFVGAFVLDRRFGLADGFDTYDDRIRRDPDAPSRLEAERPASSVVDAAVAWLGAPADARQPFFLWAHLYDPHAPYAPPPEYLQRTGGRPYEGEIAYADAQLGRLVRAARARAAASPLIVVVAGDHGESLGEHGEPTHGMLVYEAALRVPLVVNLPGVVSPGPRDRPASLQDVAPTILTLAAVAVPEAMSGSALLAPTPAREADTYAETVYPRSAGWSPVRALSDGRWKLIVSSRAELYDLASDPHEQRDVSAANPSIARGMRVRLDALWRPAVPSAKVGADAAERLRALGYVAGGSTEAPADGAPNPADHIASWAAFEQAFSDLSAGRAAKAIAPLRDLADRYPDAVVFQSTYARALSESGRSREALRLYRAVAARRPGDAWLLHDLAVAAREAGATDEALKAELAAVALDPSFASAHNGLGLLHADAGRPREAAAAFTRAAGLDSQNAAIWINLGNARRELGDAAGARQAYESALRVDPDDADAANGLGVLLVQAGRPAEAIPWFERALARTPGLYEARLNLGVALQETGQRDRAAAAYRAVIAAAPRGSREKKAAAELLRRLRPTRNDKPETRN